MKKKVLSLLLVGMMAISMFAACGSKDEPETKEPEVKDEKDDPKDLADKYFVYGYTAEGYGDYVYYFHFYEEDPVLGAVFYAGFVNNGANFAGTYEVVEEEREYTCFTDREACVDDSVDPITDKAPYTIIFYDFNGAELDRCGYDGKVLYNDMETLTGVGGGEMMYNLDTDATDKSKFASTYEGEMGVPYLDMVSVDDETCTVTLNHNMTYSDMMDIMTEGTWSKKENSDGSAEYTLTPDDGDPATVKVAADGTTATYVAADGSESSLKVLVEAKLVATYRSEQFDVPSQGIKGEAIIYLYSDGSAVFSVNLVDWNMEKEYSTGTYTGSDGNYSIEIDGTTYTAAGGSIPFKYDISGFCNIDTTLNEVTE